MTPLRWWAEYLTGLADAIEGKRRPLVRLANDTRRLKPDTTGQGGLDRWRQENPAPLHLVR